MSRKNFAGALRKTSTSQKHIIDDRFAKADSILLGLKPDSIAPLPTAALPTKVTAAMVGDEASTSAALPDAVKGGGMVIRDTFSMPPIDHELIEMLRTRAAREGRNTTKSEIVRAGLNSLAALEAWQLVKLLDGLERIKPGRK